MFCFCCNIFLTAFSSTPSDCSSLEQGSFEIYENDLKIGYVYRKKGWQIEKYLDGQNLTVAKIKSEGCLFYMKSYEVKEELDTITWAVSYTEIATNHYSFVGSPKYLEIDYNHRGEIKKISDDITPDMLEVFEQLESKSNND